MRLILILLIAFGVWSLLGEPKKTVASWLYPSRSAPWEHVVGFFYPDQHNSTDFIESPALATVAACRDWAMEKASEHGKAVGHRSDYKCGIGQSRHRNRRHVYRLVVR